MTIVKGSLRMVYKRKLETVSLIFLILISMLSYGSLLVLADNMAEQAYIQFRHTIGDVAAFGLFPSNITDYLSNISEIEEVRTFNVWFGTLDMGGERYTVSIVDKDYVDKILVFLLDGRFPRNESEVIYYYAITGGTLEGKDIVKIGDKVKVLVFTSRGVPIVRNLTVVGVAKGFAHLGGMDSTLVIHKNLMEKVIGDIVTGVGVVLKEDALDSLDEIADEIFTIYEDNNFQIFFKFVNDKERNPIVVLLESASTILTIPISIVLLLIPILIASAGSALVIREVKIVATLKSMGVGRGGLFKYYGVPWIVRGFIGIFLGILLIPYFSEYIYVNYLVRDSEIADILLKTVGFHVRYDVLMTIITYVSILILLGVSIPWFLSNSVNIVRAISTTGLYAVSTPFRKGIGFIRMRIFIRDIISRPWKLIGILLSIAILWGALTALNMEGNGLRHVYYIYENEMPFDTNIFVSTTSFMKFTELPNVTRDAILNTSDVKSYVLLSRNTYVNLFGYNEISQVITYISGDPSTAFPLIKGDFPRDLREAVISKNFALLKGVDIGDEVEVNIDGSIFRLRIVGISISRLNNGYYILVTKDEYSALTGLDMDEIGTRELVGYIDLVDGVDSDSYSKSLKEYMESRYGVSVEYVTKTDLLDQINLINSFIMGLNSGILFSIFLASVISLSSIYLVDSEARNKEIAVLKSIGFSNLGISLGAVIQVLIVAIPSAIPALILGNIIADLISRSGAQAIGYLEPVKPIESLLNIYALYMFAALSFIVLIVNWVKVRRMDVVKTLAEL